MQKLYAYLPTETKGDKAQDKEMEPGRVKPYYERLAPSD